ncbi:lysine N(6)-hydroxylase/L-ornithine N(5)-oxygenase family protein [Arthrobacter ginkgonis]|uniref:L-lysine N6-monooxygenase MbtG n=1 Tax=Arthrobacter ginkgonis TaxID=1630594 RepID=A0ABP7CH92_9MICC
MSIPDTDEYDVLGLGFGPSNMALAAAIDEHNAAVPASERLKTLFLDRAAGPEWHRNLLFEDASMQVAFAKDLATFRNPTSPLTFMNFLREQGRIADFFNRGSMAPLRIEFVAYLRWAAARLAGYVRYSSEVVRIIPRTGAGRIGGYDVDVVDEDGLRTLRTRHLVLAGGLRPEHPQGIRPGERIWHSAEFLERVERLDPERIRTVAVVGGGQSAAEVIGQMYQRFPQAQVHSVISRFGLVPSDASPYANRIFDPGAVDELYAAGPEVRAEMYELHRNTNNSVVNPDTIQALYDLDYRDRWLGTPRLHWHRASRVLEATESAPGQTAPAAPVTLRLRDGLTGRDTELAADVVILATGYRPLDPATLLGSHGALLARDGDGRVRARRDYSAVTALPDDAKLYLVGQTEHQHGLSATLLSNVAVRAGEILDSLLGKPAAAAPATAETDTAAPALAGAREGNR